MRLLTPVRFAMLIAAALAAPTPDDDSNALALLDQLSQEASENALAALANTTTKRTTTCTKDNISVRKEWGTLSAKERIAYTNAVLCLQSKSALTPTSLIPGVRSRYDDFVGTHINQTLNIHYTGTFLAWHRYFTWNYEQALRNECGYTGTQPYWNWGLSSSNTTASPIFDGSATSMSGNGEYIAGRGPLTLSLGTYPDIYLPAGTGGGCVSSGPFRNMTVNLGPVSLPLNGGGSLTGTGLDYNPRCLKRDIGTAINQLYANCTAILNLITQNNDIWDFEMVMQGVPGSGNIGVHGGGHYTIAGDPGADVFTSPGDPAFYLHHSMIDRVWWIWQNLDLANRKNAISGTGTFLNYPPSANTTLDTLINLGYAAGTSIAMRELMSTTEGPFCYTYQ
ncbi:related to monophenol monooxygenase (tyrosinase) [Phialocephala subalpina]|uniref:Related to monophenol monooxygenase (Tyrosinase) n=1 Tax=Phialocephala subalpina TaxID=576137 RepID=A0A1L7XCA5_9HELO|nr:related to monophenol monooxygenase (tyrosinase) [Phialocephala subalpina]